MDNSSIPTNTDPQPGPSHLTGSSINSIAIAIPEQPKPGINKLDQLTTEQIDQYMTSETLAQYEFSGDRHLLIYDIHQVEEIPASETTEELSDEFFELSKGEAQKLLRDIIRTRDQLENGALMTKAMRDLNSAKRTLATLHQYNYSVVRLHLPNGHVVQALFKPLESIGKVKAYVRQFLISPDLDFYIYLTPPKTILQDSATLFDLRCVPTSNFYLGVREDSLQQRARNPALNFMDDEGEVSPSPSSSKSPNLSPPVSKTPRPRTSQDKIPKWFKPGGK
ncbi:hypothetical protein M8J75_008119 [Diaphorina citri]|nr:hypothetical protein M8J75_008119 [Diaphorina citri]